MTLRNWASRLSRRASRGRRFEQNVQYYLIFSCLLLLAGPVSIRLPQ